MACNWGHTGIQFWQPLQFLAEQRAQAIEGFCLDMFFSSQNQTGVMQYFASGMWTIVSSFLVTTEQRVRGRPRGHPGCCSSRPLSALPGGGTVPQEGGCTDRNDGARATGGEPSAVNGQRCHQQLPTATTPNWINAALSGTKPEAAGSYKEIAFFLPGPGLSPTPDLVRALSPRSCPPCSTGLRDGGCRHRLRPSPRPPEGGQRRQRRYCACPDLPRMRPAATAFILRED